MNPSPLDGDAGSGDIQDGGDVTAVTQAFGNPRPRVDSADLQPSQESRHGHARRREGDLLRDTHQRAPVGSAATPVAGRMPIHQPFTVRDARLFDGTRVLEATHLRVVDGHVDAVGGPCIVGDGDAVVDGGGGRLLPGLIDAPVHLLPGRTQLAATFGVTTVIDQFSKPEVIDPERAAIAAAEAADGPAEADLRTSSIGATAPGGHTTIAYAPIP